MKTTEFTRTAPELLIDILTDATAAQKHGDTETMLGALESIAATVPDVLALLASSDHTSAPAITMFNSVRQIQLHPCNSNVDAVALK